MKKLGILIAVVVFGLVVFAQADLDAVVTRLELLEEYTNMIYETLGNYVTFDDFTLTTGELDGNLKLLMNRLELLEEYTNMIYETLGGYLSSNDFETFKEELEVRLSELEVQILNIQNTLAAGLPALRDMVYGLSGTISDVERSLTSYVDVSVNEVKLQIEEMAVTIEDLLVTLDIHDGDILKIYETLGVLSEQIAALEEKLAILSDVETMYETLELVVLKLDMHDQDIVNIFDNLAMKADREQVDNLEASLSKLYESVDGLNEILTGLAAKLGDTDYTLRKGIETLEKNMNAKLDNLAKEVKETTTKIDNVDKKVDSVNIIAWLGVVLGAVALVLPFLNNQ